MAVVGLLCLQQANATTLKNVDIEQIFSNQYTVGELNPNVPVWPLFLKSATDANIKPTLFGYAFESVDFEPVRGYGGKPIDVMVVMDVNGHKLASSPNFANYLAEMEDHIARHPHIQFFNASPCGAEILGAQPSSEYSV